MVLQMDLFQSAGVGVGAAGAVGAEVGAGALVFWAQPHSSRRKTIPDVTMLRMFISP